MAKAIYTQKGDNIDFTASSDVGYMDVVPLEDRVGVALEDIPAGKTGTITLTGTFKMPAGAGEIKQGEKVYWDGTNEVVTATSSSNTFVGYSVIAKPATADTVSTAYTSVRLG
ncbi:DUF2190 family protein [Selenomonas sp. AB3002]|uniref:DUF2190 family protein n=1 Tax=Selenomonas sp. AB3002 TaxID=1392502 RepID=UPI00068B4CB7